MECLESASPCFCWSRPYPLVKAHTDRIHWIDLTVKRGLEVAMSTQALFDETLASTRSPQRQSTEPSHIFFVEEHVADSNEFLMDLVWMSRENDSLGDDPRCG